MILDGVIHRKHCRQAQFQLASSVQVQLKTKIIVQSQLELSLAQLSPSLFNNSIAYHYLKSACLLPNFCQPAPAEGLLTMLTRLLATSSQILKWGENHKGIGNRIYNPHNTNYCKVNSPEHLKNGFFF